MEKFVYNYTNFGGGVDIASSPDAIPENCVADSLNADFTSVGAIKVRKKFVKVANAVDGVVSAISPFYSNRTQLSLLMFQSGSNLYNKNGEATTLVSHVTDIHSALTFWSPSMVKDVWIFSDNGLLRKYDGTAVSALSADAPSGKYLAILNNRLAVGGRLDKPDTISLSKIGNPEDFSEGIELAFKTWRGDEVVGLVEFGGVLYVFMRHSIGICSGDVIDNFQMDADKANLGALAPKTITTNGILMVFLGNDKVLYGYDGTNLVDFSTDRVKPYFDNLDDNKIDECVGMINGSDYYITVPQKDGTYKFLLYNISSKVWTEFGVVTPTAMGAYRDGDVDVVVFGDTNGYVYGFGDSPGGDVSILPSGDPVDTQLDVKLRPLGLENPANRKKFKKVILNVKSASPVTMKYYTNEEPDVQTLTLDCSGDMPREFLYTNGRVLYIELIGASDTVINGVSVIGVLKNPK
jgi:hypothetical protein